MFYLALSLGLERDPLDALARMAALVERTGRAYGEPETLWMTLGVSDGESIWAVRYASDGQAPTLYYSKSAEDLAPLNPDIYRVLGERARAVVSEPIGKFSEIWTEVPQSSALRIHDGKVELSPFRPAD
jgi:glutamine amidotransferase